MIIYILCYSLTAVILCFLLHGPNPGSHQHSLNNSLYLMFHFPLQSILSRANMQLWSCNFPLRKPQEFLTTLKEKLNSVVWHLRSPMNLQATTAASSTKCKIFLIQQHCTNYYFWSSRCSFVLILTLRKLLLSFIHLFYRK